jgi:hypothetical protein
MMLRALQNPSEGRDRDEESSRPMRVT